MLELHNSLSQKQEKFSTITNKKVSIYVCGITPYDTTHLGHAFTYLAFDVLIRYLQFLGYDVTYTQNVTDINDRDNDILKRAQEKQIPWEELSSYWTERFLTDMQGLHWVMPTLYLKASEQIPGMVSLIEKIIANGFGYVVHGSVYLDTERDPDFGKLSKLNREQMMIRAKEFEEDITNPDKRHPLDITLWRSSSLEQAAHIPSFASPWGQGRPGWHIECSAMSIASLGEQIDIHGGGIDLLYPHHESEIAQSEAGTGKKPFARFWLHTGTVGINGRKMSKSLGNLILIADLVKKYSPNAIRWLLLSHHYRSAWEYTEDALIQAAEIWTKIEKLLAVSKPEEIAGNAIFMRGITHDLNNDLQVPAVLQKITATVLTEKIADDIPTIVSIQETLRLLGFTL